MTKITYVGVAAAMLLACAPTVAQETAEAPEAPDTSVANDVSGPDTTVAAEETAATEAEDADADSSTAPADPVVCKRGETVRHVNLVEPGAQGRLCEVHYAKPTEGVENRVLWYATSDKSFCDEKANNLMSKLSGAGFSCVNPDGTPVSIEASASAEEAAETKSAPESAPAGADAPADPDEPADAPEASEAPAEEADEPAEEEPSEEGDQ